MKLFTIDGMVVRRIYPKTIARICEEHGEATCYVHPNKMILCNPWQKPSLVTFSSLEDYYTYLSHALAYMPKEMGDNLAIYIPVNL